MCMLLKLTTCEELDPCVEAIKKKERGDTRKTGTGLNRFIYGICVVRGKERESFLACFNCVSLPIV